MNNTKIILIKELQSYFNSPMAYIFLVVFALTNGYFFTNTFFLYNQSDNVQNMSSITLTKNHRDKIVDELLVIYEDLKNKKS